MNNVSVISSKVCRGHNYLRCKSSTGVHSLIKRHIIFNVPQKCHVCSRRPSWPHKVLKCEVCSYWCHKTCLAGVVTEASVELLPGSDGDYDDSEMESLLEECKPMQDGGDELVANIYKPLRLQSDSANGNQRTVESIPRSSGEITAYRPTTRWFETKNTAGETITSPAQQVPQHSRPRVTSSRRTRRRFATSALLHIFFRPIDDTFRYLNLFVHDTCSEIYGEIVPGAVQHVRRHVSRPVRPPRRRRIAIPQDGGLSTVVQRIGPETPGDDDGDLSDYEILLFCRSPYRTRQPLRSSVPTNDLWY